MLSISDIKLGTICKVANDPYEVIWTQQVQMGRSGSILRIKIKNLVDGKVLEKTLKGNDNLESADVSRSKVNFLYSDNEGFHFMDNETYEQFTFSADKIGDKKKYLKDGTEVIVMKSDNTPLTISLPIKMEFKVTSAAEGVKGNTAQGNVSKTAEIETGAEISVPMFIKEGELIKVNTETGEYVERVNK